MPVHLSDGLTYNPLLVMRAVFWGRPRHGDAAFNMAVRIRFGIVPHDGDDPHDGVLAILHIARSKDPEKLYSVYCAAKENATVARAYLVDVTERAGHILLSAPINAQLPRGDSLMAVFNLGVPE